MLKFHQFYSAKKNTRRDMLKARKLLLPNWKRQKIHLAQSKTSKNEKLREKKSKYIFRNISGKSHTAENPTESSMIAKFSFKIEEKIKTNYKNHIVPKQRRSWKNSDSFEKYYYFPTHIFNGEENHHQCCVFFPISAKSPRSIT